MVLKRRRLPALTDSKNSLASLRRMVARLRHDAGVTVAQKWSRDVFNEQLSISTLGVNFYILKSIFYYSIHNARASNTEAKRVLRHRKRWTKTISEACFLIVESYIASGTFHRVIFLHS